MTGNTDIFEELLTMSNSLSGIKVKASEIFRAIVDIGIAIFIFAFLLEIYIDNEFASIFDRYKFMFGYNLDINQIVRL